MFLQAIENIEKLNNPPLIGINNAMVGDSVVDTSANGLIMINESYGGSVPPFSKIYDVGDPTPLVSYLIPYLNEKIATGFKTDILLDFASAKDMTATESMQRYAIRGRSLSGIIGQQKSELLDVLIERNLQIEDDLGLVGIDPDLNPEEAQRMRELNNSNVIIPEVVLKRMRENKKWYKIRYNNELERLTKTEKLERIMQMINGISMLASLNSQILGAIDFYAMLKDVNEALGMTYIKSEEDFKAIVAQQAEMQAQAMAIQAGQAGSEIAKNLGTAQKDVADANNR
jgi:hypothetical protein